LKYRCPTRHYGYDCEGREKCPVKGAARIPLSENRRVFTPRPAAVMPGRGCTRNALRQSGWTAAWMCLSALKSTSFGDWPGWDCDAPWRCVWSWPWPWEESEVLSQNDWQKKYLVYNQYTNIEERYTNLTKEKIYKDLKERILRDELSAGQWLVERDLCNKYQISRTPMRQVLQRLVS